MWGTAGRPRTAPTGSIDKFQVKDDEASMVVDHLNFPNMIALGLDNILFVTANSICPADSTTGLCSGGGKILRISGDHLEG